MFVKAEKNKKLSISFILKHIILFWTHLLQVALVPLVLSGRRPLLHRNQSIDLLCKSMDWFLCHSGLHLERVKANNKASI